MNQNNNTKRYVIIGGIVVIIVVVVSILAAGGSPHKNTSSTKQQQASGTMGTVTLNYSTANISGTVAKFNGKTVQPVSTTNTSQTYNVAPNEYKLAVTDTGYTSFSTDFSVAKGQTIIVDIHTSLKSNPAITSIDQVQLPGVDVSNTTITGISYFYNKTWAIIGIQSEGDTAIVVSQYNAAYGVWITLLGPGTSFSSASAQNMPQDVQNYLTVNNYINPEAQ